MVKNKEKTKILLIEDDKFISDLYKDGLEWAGLKMITAYDGKEGMEKIKSENPDLILLDLVLPTMNGFEILEKIKRDDKFKNIPIIILSNLSEKEDVKKAMELGADDYLVKVKFSIKEVIAKVKFNLKKLKTSQKI